MGKKNGNIQEQCLRVESGEGFVTGQTMLTEMSISSCETRTGAKIK
jgi:hypothetical protein